ncbi:ig-like domain-containing protein [Rubrivivax gelatinosus]|uniref:ig-like domain-containing protein n=1 Tax=Rubrivivax gelatinosus TaxID=28068 RepID=UPI003D323CAD
MAASAPGRLRMSICGHRIGRAGDRKLASRVLRRRVGVALVERAARSARHEPITGQEKSA